MLAHDIIKLSHIPELDFRSFVQQALDSALWHYILFFNEEDDVDQKINSLLKESLSLALFRFFCVKNNLPIEFSYENGDRVLLFKIEENNWELINLSVEKLENSNFESSDLPAMIPSQELDCTRKDEFGNKIIQWKHSIEKYVLFTYFIDNSNTGFVNLNLPANLKQLYLDILKQNNALKIMKESDFREKLKNIGIPEFTINYRPEFYITAWAGVNHLKFFYSSNSQDFPQIKTAFYENKSVLIHHLPAFSLLFPKLKETLHFAKFLS